MNLDLYVVGQSSSDPSEWEHGFDDWELVIATGPEQALVIAGLGASSRTPVAKVDMTKPGRVLSYCAPNTDSPPENYDY